MTAITQVQGATPLRAWIRLGSYRRRVDASRVSLGRVKRLAKPACSDRSLFALLSRANSNLPRRITLGLCSSLPSSYATKISESYGRQVSKFATLILRGGPYQLTHYSNVAYFLK